jgi:uncharacterized protein
MRCPHCQADIDDRVPSCPDCAFHVRDLDADLGEPPVRGDGSLVDGAGVLSEEERRVIASRAARFRRVTGHDLAVVTVESAAPRLPSEYVFWLFDRWGMGPEGVLILLALAERRVEVEVGWGLEGWLSDAAADRILEDHAAPILGRGDLAQGLQVAADLVARVIEHARGLR